MAATSSSWRVAFRSVDRRFRVSLEARWVGRNLKLPFLPRPIPGFRWKSPGLSIGRRRVCRPGFRWKEPRGCVEAIPGFVGRSSGVAWKPSRVPLEGGPGSVGSRPGFRWKGARDPSEAVPGFVGRGPGVRRKAPGVVWKPSRGWREQSPGFGGSLSFVSV
jgi:hypothetical protein